MERVGAGPTAAADDGVDVEEVEGTGPSVGGSMTSMPSRVGGPPDPPGDLAAVGDEQLADGSTRGSVRGADPVPGHRRLASATRTRLTRQTRHASDHQRAGGEVPERDPSLDRPCRRPIRFAASLGLNSSVKWRDCRMRNEDAQGEAAWRAQPSSGDSDRSRSDRGVMRRPRRPGAGDPSAHEVRERHRPARRGVDVDRGDLAIRIRGLEPRPAAEGVRAEAPQEHRLVDRPATLEHEAQRQQVDPHRWRRLRPGDAGMGHRVRVDREPARRARRQAARHQLRVRAQQPGDAVM